MSVSVTLHPSCICWLCCWHRSCSALNAQNFAEENAKLSAADHIQIFFLRYCRYTVRLVKRCLFFATWTSKALCRTRPISRKCFRIAGCLYSKSEILHRQSGRVVRQPDQHGRLSTACSPCLERRRCWSGCRRDLLKTYAWEAALLILWAEVKYLVTSSCLFGLSVQMLANYLCLCPVTKT